MALVVAGAAGAACASGAAAQAGGSALQSTQTACRASDLKALFRGFQPAGASLTGAVVVTTTGAQPCWIAGAPQSVTLLDEDGDTIAVKSRPVAVPVDAGAVELLPGAGLPAFGAPPARGSAWFVVTWANWCQDVTPPSVSSLLIVLPTGGSVAAPLEVSPGWASGRVTPRCDDARAGSSITVGRFQAPST